MRVIGVDPGSAITGFGVVEKSSGGLQYLGSGTIRTNSRHSRGVRLKTIYDQLQAVIADHAPVAMSLERSFVAENVQSAFRLGETRGVAMLAAAANDLELFEYDPTAVKLTIAGYGRADKAQVKFMVMSCLGIHPQIKLADDASDALALALCHLARASMPMGAQSQTSWRNFKQGSEVINGKKVALR
jgi:crossover junction endodeoxyribonuclease RuvC